MGMALTRLVRKGTVRRLARGLYDYPVTHPLFGIVPPAPDLVAKALAGRDATRLQPSGAYAANLLGLSDQVPMKIVFLTDGPSRTVAFGRQQIMLRHTTPRNMATAGRISGTVIQALRWLGRRHVDDGTMAILRGRLSAADRRQVAADIRYAPGWMAEMLRGLAKEGV